MAWSVGGKLNLIPTACVDVFLPSSAKKTHLGDNFYSFDKKDAMKQDKESRLLSMNIISVSANSLEEVFRFNPFFTPSNAHKNAENLSSDFSSVKRSQNTFQVMKFFPSFFFGREWSNFMFFFAVFDVTFPCAPGGASEPLVARDGVGLEFLNLEIKNTRIIKGCVGWLLDLGVDKRLIRWNNSIVFFSDMKK